MPVAPLFQSTQTPRGVKIVLWISILLSLISPIITYFCIHYFGLAGPGAWLSLSLPQLKMGHWWQPFTYFWIHSPDSGLSLSLLFSLFFHMLILWAMGTEMEVRFGTAAFLLFYLGLSTLAGFFAALLLFLLSSQSVIFGSFPGIYSLCFLWTMYHADLKMVLLARQIKLKWVVAGALLLFLLITLSHGDYVAVLTSLFSLLLAGLIGHFVWHLPNPYPLNLRSSRTQRASHGKIIDISVFQEDDEAFMDRMLDKIAREGEATLTTRERARMEKISANKRQK